MSLGPVMLDVQGTELSAEEREMLCHPLVGGVILFSRNYESPEQLMALLQAIHDLRTPRLLVSVDHEGGRVQRFRSGFTRLPPAGVFGRIYQNDKRRARRLAESAGWLMATELRAAGVDFSFAPVLDIDFGVSEVIGDRAFNRDPDAIADLAGAYVAGMHRAGMAATGKHFPGHGAVAADSHLALPVDERPFADIEHTDLVPFRRLGDQLAAVMPAHVIYSEVDSRPAGFSPVWLRDILRQRMGFKGLIFSDDLDMEGARIAGDYPERAEAALGAGCDVALICNNREGAIAILDRLKVEPDPLLHARLARMHGRPHEAGWQGLHQDPAWHQTMEAIQQLEDDPSMELEF